MNQRLLIVPVVGALALAGTSLLPSDEAELPPEPVFPAAVAPAGGGWTQEPWSASRFVPDPFDSSAVLGAELDPADIDLPEDVGPEPDLEGDAEAPVLTAVPAPAPP